MKTIIALIFSLALSLSTAYAIDINKLSLDDAVSIAKQADKNILIIFSIDNCIFCEMLKNEVVMFNIDNYVLCIVDVTNNAEIAKSFKLRIFPTSMILSVKNKEEKIIDTYIGYNKEKYPLWIEKNDIQKSVK